MELVVLLDDDGRAIGTEPKATVHTAETPLHLAFSSYVFDPQGRLLLTQRALDKSTFPGVWTNSCCGHPGPGESFEDTVRRRVQQELGVTVGKVDPVLPAFRYRAVMDNGIVENEICPVFRVQYDGGAPNPEPSEVENYEWVDWTPFVDSVLSGERDVSIWCAEQVRQLVALGPDPSAWPVATEADLPPAARG